MEKYVSLNLWAIRAIGIPYPKITLPTQSMIYFLLRSLSISSLLFILIPATVAAWSHLDSKDFSTIVEILALVLSSGVVLYKTVNLILQKNRVVYLIDEMSQFWRGAKNDEIEAMERFAETGKRATQFYFTLGLLNVVTFVGQPFLNSYLTSPTTLGNSSNLKLNQLPFNGWEYLSDSESTILFIVLYVCHVVVCTAATVASVGHDCLLVVLIIHVCGNLRAIAVRLRRLQFFDKYLHDVESEVFSCGKKLQSLIDYTAEVEKIISPFLLVQTLHSGATICLTGFMMSRNIRVNKEIGKYILYWAAAVFQLFIFCWTGNYLQTETNLIGRSAYDAYGKLMNVSPKNQRDRYLVKKIPRYLQIILLRSQTPIKISAGKFYAMTLENYKNILSNSHSYFTILRAFAEDET